MILDFAKSGRSKLYPGLDGNAGLGTPKACIRHVFVVSRWKLIQKCRVSWSAEFVGNDHRLLAATEAT